ncbi:uncharacterized protein BDZ99DRAFT_496077 [Mytilinidion resinicola]|uniref:Rhodopsin domain-containing protein n=1 Tax=Mytilinidion resinicola TaxID=574789 RepID=A0A6A6YVX7_9PEZI|nr:uncharacterized protein BDZ99DRAFT_496077 [Mytilinidion resinicola]KAF2812961.1 hypothetical protein BDZ99DRAFT_496077 [Mytilinidion resinicola]
MATRDYKALIPCTIFFAISTALIFTRMYVRGARLRNVGTDDVLCCIAGAFNIGVTTCFLLRIEYQYRAVDWVQTPYELRISMLSYYLSMPFYQLALGCIKASIIFQYRRIFRDALGYAYTVLLALVICNSTAFFLIMTFRCSPIDGPWTNRSTVCMDVMLINYIFIAINFSTDIVLLVLPMRILRDLNLARAEKRGLVFVFGLGGFAALTSILRLQYVLALRSDDDMAYNGLLMWCCIEISVSIICASLPSLNGIMARRFPRIWRKDSTYRSSRPSTRWTPRHLRDKLYAATPKGQESTERISGAITVVGSNRSSSSKKKIEVTTTFKQSVEDKPAGTNTEPRAGTFCEPGLEGREERHDWCKHNSWVAGVMVDMTETRAEHGRANGGPSETDLEMIPLETL